MPPNEDDNRRKKESRTERLRCAQLLRDKSVSATAESEMGCVIYSSDFAQNLGASLIEDLDGRRRIWHLATANATHFRSHIE